MAKTKAGPVVKLTPSAVPFAPGSRREESARRTPLFDVEITGARDQAKFDFDVVVETLPNR